MANVNRKVQNLSSDEKTGGSIRVHESVVSSIVRKSVLATEGVIRFAGNTFVDNIAEFVGSKAMQDRAISVEMGEGSVAISAQIVVEYGLYIPDVALKVQEAVQSQVQELTGITVSRVNVMVMDIEVVKSEDEEDDE